MIQAFVENHDNAKAVGAMDEGRRFATVTCEDYIPEPSAAIASGRGVLGVEPAVPDDLPEELLATKVIYGTKRFADTLMQWDLGPSSTKVLHFGLIPMENCEIDPSVIRTYDSSAWFCSLKYGHQHWLMKSTMFANDMDTTDGSTSIVKFDRPYHVMPMLDVFVELSKLKLDGLLDDIIVTALDLWYTVHDHACVRSETTLCTWVEASSARRKQPAANAKPRKRRAKHTHRGNKAKKKPAVPNRILDDDEPWTQVV